MPRSVRRVFFCIECIDLCLPLPLKTTRFGTDKDAGPAAWGRRSGPEDAVLLSYLILAVPSQARLTIQPLYSYPSEPLLSDY